MPEKNTEHFVDASTRSYIDYDTKDKIKEKMQEQNKILNSYSNYAQHPIKWNLSNNLKSWNALKDN